MEINHLDALIEKGYPTIMVKQTQSERRNSVRAKRILSIQYRLFKARKKNAEEPWCLSMTEDMSVGGLSFYTDKEFAVDDTLEMHVVMSGVLDIFNGLGKVVRVERKKTGVYFLVGIKFVDKNTRSNRRQIRIEKAAVLKRKIKRM